jgi:hypothetical protein
VRSRWIETRELAAIVKQSLSIAVNATMEPTCTHNFIYPLVSMSPY